MERTSKSIVFVDTHIVVWLFENRLDRLSREARHALEKNQILISPMVELELEFLREIQKIKHSSKRIVEELSLSIGLEVTYSNFHQVIQYANGLSWTRDPFDRIIVAEAMVHQAALISADRTIQQHYSRVIEA